VFERGAIEGLLRSSGFHVEQVVTRQSLARIGDSIKHLDGSSRHAALKVFTDAPEEFKDRYGISGEVTVEDTYTMLWEFIVARP
jgi:hypothetical protein